jgi:hypothetical protein
LRSSYWHKDSLARTPEEGVLMTDTELAGRLRHWAAGLPGMDSALDVLEAHGWLDDCSFLKACVCDIDGADLATIDWAAAEQLLALSPVRTGLGEAIDTARATYSRLGIPRGPGTGS